MRQFSLVILLLTTFLFGQSQSKNFLDLPYIEVNGSADTLLTPNEIFIRIVISERDTKDKSSVEEQEVKMVNALKGLGVDVEKELTTNDMSSNFKSYLLKSKDVLKSKQYTLKVKDAVTASKVFIRLEELAISNTSIERVNHSELENIKNAMRGSAVLNAKARAVALTKPLNQVVGSAINIIDNENYNNNIMLRGTSSLNEVVVVGYGRDKNKAEELANIEFRKINVTANVNVKFLLR